MENTSQIKRLQQFVSRRTGQKVRVTQVKKSDLNSRKHDECRIMNVQSNGMTDKTTARVVKSDTIRRHYTKF